MNLAPRALLLVLILAIEKLPLDFIVNVDAAEQSTGFAAVVLLVQHLAFRFGVALMLFLLLFAYARGRRSEWVQVNEAFRNAKVRVPLCFVHVLAVLPLVPLTYFLYGRSDAPLPFAVLVALWVLFALGAVVALAAALAPWRAWWDASRHLGMLWFYAALAAASATSMIRWSQHLWAPTAALTFEMVRHVLSPILPGLQADSRSQILSNSGFAIQITEYCSGLEGVGLMLAFCGAWLLCFREHYRFPRALLLLPAGIALSCGLNVLRIALLMLIGNSGFPGVAAFGFHSQAGWIAFIFGAGFIAVTSLRSGWLARSPDVSPPRGIRSSSAPLSTAIETGARPANLTAIYLLPFLSLLAAGMLARAVSSGFETLYVLRVIAAVTALAWGWRWLRTLDWRYSWRGAFAGIACFAIWAFSAQLLMRPQPMSAALAALPEPGRMIWITIRAVAAVVVVPIAEELAFRGYLMRRIAAVDFDRVPFKVVGVTALFISSLLFGIEHGVLWVPATLVGIVYGRLLIQTGRMGEVVLAHGTAAALLTIDVLLRGQWQFW